MKHALKMGLLGLAMFLVAFVAGAAALRLSIHGREVSVPSLEGKSDAEAAAIASDLGLNLSVENRFYSAAMAPNHVLSQSPVAGSKVRRGWQVRVTESLGGQKVEVPDLTGTGERPASLVLRRQQLELGMVVRLPAPGLAGLVLGQSPPPNTVGLNGPKVSLVVSDDLGAQDATAAYVMPMLVGTTLAVAEARLSAVGLRVASATGPQQAVVTPPVADAVDPAATPVPAVPAGPDVAVAVAPTPASPNGVITSQSPAPGHRVTRTDSIRVTVAAEKSLVVPVTVLP